MLPFLQCLKFPSAFNLNTPLKLYYLSQINLKESKRFEMTEKIYFIAFIFIMCEPLRIKYSLYSRKIPKITVVRDENVERPDQQYQL